MKSENKNSDNAPNTITAQWKIESDISFINIPHDLATHPDANLEALSSEADKLILLVEDNDMVRDTIHHALNYGGYSVVSTPSGNHALDLIRKHSEKFALVISDQCLPETSGLEVLKEIHRISPKTNVILMSGYYLDDGHQPSLDSTFAEFIHKPCSIVHLLERVRMRMS